MAADTPAAAGMTLVRKKCGTGHSYKLDGETVTGVTTLIKKGFPAPGLVGWSGKVIAAFIADAADTELADLRMLDRDAIITSLLAQPVAQRNAAAARGTQVHGLAERLSRGEQLEYGTDIPEELEGHVESCLAFLDQWQPAPVLTEATIGSRWMPYAGTLDLIADIPGIGRALLDYKTGGVWPDVALQLAAYRFADFYVGADGTEQPMSEVGVECTFVVQIRADGYDVIPINTGASRDESMAFQTFRAAAYIAQRYDMVREQIGAALTPPVLAVAA
jgi:hypothetical protein